MKFSRIILSALTLTLVAAFVPSRSQAQANAEAKTLFITEDGRFSVELSAGWYAVGDSTGLQLTNREALLGETDLAAGNPGDLTLVVLPVAKSQLEGIGLTPNASIPQIAEALISLILEEGTTLGEIEAIDENTSRMTYGDEISDGVIYAVDYFAPETVSILLMAATKGEFSQAAESEMLGIYESVQYSLELTETYYAADGFLSFAYPTHWLTKDREPNFGYLFNNQATLDTHAAEEDNGLGQIRIIVQAFAAADFAPIVTDEVLVEDVMATAEWMTSESLHHPVISDPIFIESASLTTRIVYVRIKSDIADGGVMIMYNAATDIVAGVIFAGGLEIGDRLFLTALTIGQSALPTA